MDESFKNITASIQLFQNDLKHYLPALEKEVFQLIKNKSNNSKEIEMMLDTLLSLTDLGIGDDLYIKLLEHYKTIDAEGAAFYWNGYDRKNDEEF